MTTLTSTTTVPTGPPMRADARRNYERLLKVAKETFVESGADASLDEIAKRAGVGVGTLYRHFPTRQALLEDVVSDQLATLHQLADELLQASDPAQGLADWLRAMMEHSTTFRGLTATLMMPMLEKGPVKNTRCQEIHAAGDSLLSRAQEAGVVRADVTIGELLKLTNAIAIACESASNCRVQSERLLSLVMDGVRTS